MGEPLRAATCWLPARKFTYGFCCCLHESISGGGAGSEPYLVEEGKPLQRKILPIHRGFSPTPSNNENPIQKLESIREIV